MRKRVIKPLCYALIALSLTGCGLFGSKDNTPKPAALVAFKPTAQVRSVWSTSTGGGNGGKFLRLDAAYDQGVIYTASHAGTITATDAKTGDERWSVNVRAPITAGPAAKDGQVVVGTNDARVISVSEANGQLRWTHTVSSVVLAAPTISNGAVFVKSIDGKLVSLDANTGKRNWRFSQDVPSLMLRGSSPATATDTQVYAGFANGTLVSLSAADGSSNWQQAIATAMGDNNIENMIDIDAKPIVQNGIVYTVSYQGNLAALNAITGTVLWQHAFSSYSGIAVDNHNVYATDAKGHVWAFDQNTGAVLWHQDALSWRTLTGPVVLNNTIAVADMEGYLHFLSPKNGQFVARVSVGSPILATPTVANNTVYVATANGDLAAYQLTS